MTEVLTPDIYRELTGPVTVPVLPRSVWETGAAVTAPLANHFWVANGIGKVGD
jgi:hypothetical protein